MEASLPTVSRRVIGIFAYGAAGPAAAEMGRPAVARPGRPATRR